MTGLFDIIRNLVITNNHQEVKPISQLNYDYLGIYFTAPWCSAYRIHQLSRGIPGLNFEIATFSLDTDPDYISYLQKTSPYWTIRPTSEEAHDAVMKQLKVINIPKLVIFDREGKILSENGVGDVYKYKNGIFQYWNQFV